MISFRNISKTINNTKILKDVSINMGKGQIYGFLGNNGAGKTTTMNIITNLLNYDTGSCTIDNNKYELSSLYKKINIGYLMEEPVFYPWMTGIENLNFYTKSKKSTAELEKLLHTVGLSNAIKKKSSSYSRGMKQRLGIACALVNDPDLIILDEPTSALDPEGRKDVLDLIQSLKENGKSIIFSTHILNDAEKVCDKIGIIKKGETILEDTLTNIFKNYIFPIYIFETVEELNIEQQNKLRNINSVIKCSFKGFSIEVTMTDSKSSITELLNFFISNDIEIRSLNQKSNDLESIFIDKVGEEK